MTADDRKMLSLVSILLQYPDAEFFRQLDELEETDVLRSICGKSTCVTAFLQYARSLPRIVLQERYTAAFDLNPATSLNITYHRWKDGEKRATALAMLEKVYLDAGFERISGELPDYLPLMLEFLSIRPDADGVEWVWACLQQIGDYMESLRKTEPVYAGLLEPVARITPAFRETELRPAGIDDAVAGSSSPDPPYHRR